MQIISLWLRWGVPQDAPTLKLTSGSADNTPDFILSGDLAVSDTVRFSYSTDSGFSGASEITNAIDAAEDAANALSFATGTLAYGTWYFRARIERPPRGITAWSNTETITLMSPGGPISLFGRWFGGFGAAPQNVAGYISLFGKWFGGFGSSGTAPEPTPTKRGGGTYLTQAELRRLRKQLDHKEAQDRAVRDRIGQTVAKAYEDIVDPPHVRQARERAERLQAQLDQEEEDFVTFLINNYDTLH